MARARDTRASDIEALCLERDQRWDAGEPSSRSTPTSGPAGIDPLESGR